jgi:hypothetical protein
MVGMFRQQLDNIRLIDRQLGAMVAHNETIVKAEQVAELLSYATATRIRQRLASLLSELYCLAGWQALDLGQPARSWHYYDLANSVAFESDNYAFKALAEAGRGFVLVDVGKAATAVELVGNVSKAADRACSHLTRSWISAAHGEVLAADNHAAASLHTFDRAAQLLATSTADDADPYMALDSIHLARWRGYALARCANPSAVDVLSDSLSKLDPTFLRAETALRVDLVHAFVALDEPSEAADQARKAADLAIKIGSVRQRRRVTVAVQSRLVGKSAKCD